MVALVLLAAVMHASWNALVKASRERWLTFAVVSATGAVAYLPVALWLGLPSLPSLRFVAISATIHVFYYSFLLSGYRFGDLGQVYPIARGTGPLIVALASAPLAGEVLGAPVLAGVALVSVGIFALATRTGAASRRAVGFALATGLCIAGYTLADGLGVRASGSKLGYVAWLHLAIGSPFSSVVLVARRRELARFWALAGWRAVGGGLVAAAAYSLVIWAMSGAKLAYVASLRETSVILAALIGALALGEPFGRRRVAAAALVAFGIVLMSVGR